MQVTSMLSAGYLQPSSSARSMASARKLQQTRQDAQAAQQQDLKATVASSGSSPVKETDESAALSRQEQDVLSQEQSLRARAGGAEVQTVYHYTLGADGRRYITGASVTLRGEEQDLNRVGGGVTTKDIKAQARDDEGTRRVEGSEDKSGSRKSDDSTKDADKKGSGGGELSEEEEAQVRELRQIDREVRTHEAAHQAAAGALGGGASFSYTQGPDGKSYATGGEVPIHFKQGSTPEETLRNMQQVQRAANAPADPSGQDRSVAAQAAAMAAQARQEIATERTEDRDGESGKIATVAKGTPVLSAWEDERDEEDPSKNGVASILAAIRESRIQGQLLSAA